MSNEKTKEKTTGKKRTVITVVIIGIIAVCVAAIVVSCIMIFTNIAQYQQGQELYANAQQIYTTKNDSAKSDESGNGWTKMFDVDFRELNKVNKDIIGWLYFENEDISYPILYSGDDETYLHAGYDGQYLYSGSIFMEGKNNKNFTDAHTILYGHNMNDRSMFGRLLYYKEQENYYSSHKYFQILTDGKKYRYKIVSYKDVPSTGSLYTVYDKSDSKFISFMKKTVLSDSYIDTDFTPKEGDTFVTLSTCSAGDYRFTVTAVRVDEA